ncbi:CRISPR-associated protein Cas4 [bacterium]|nr:CRISPR-associated protein Cas4 [bacterium]
MNDDLEPVMISSLEHYSYCPRQCALIYAEQTFDENIYTLRGRAVHERVDEVKSTVEDGIQVERSLPLWSRRLGLVGKADVVEFHGDVPYPVEYKHGPKRKKEHDELQVCAQAICLEEMFGKSVPCGAIFHASSRRRREVIFDQTLREKVESAIKGIRKILQAEKLPQPANDARCRNCSLYESCMPSMAEKVRLKIIGDGLFKVEAFI